MQIVVPIDMKIKKHIYFLLCSTEERKVVNDMWVIDFFFFFFNELSLHSKKCWVVLTQLWVKYGLTQPLG